jgi:agmatine deiminase
VSAPITDRTPREDGFAMPAEWAPHQATLIAWPTRTRAGLWGALFEEAERDYATVANAIAAFEPVVMVVDPSQAADVRPLLRDDVELLPVPIDDSWIRDSGPIFVVDDRAQVALVHFGFNAWGERFHPYDRDAEAPAAIAAHLGMRRYVAPMILEGGSINVDGEGTLLTTETCNLNLNRNPSMSREQVDGVLSDYLGADSVVWLPYGWSKSRDTDGHVDGVAMFVEPGRALVLAPADPADPDHERGAANVHAIETTPGARGRAIEAIRFDPGAPVDVIYLNTYLTNGGGAIVPMGGIAQDEIALAQLRDAMPGRELVPVPGVVLHEGGGGPHCITQQVPAGTPVA